MIDKRKKNDERVVPTEVLTEGKQDEKEQEEIEITESIRTEVYPSKCQFFFYVDIMDPRGEGRSHEEIPERGAGAQYVEGTK